MNFNKPAPFQFECNRKVIISNLADLECSGASNIEDTFVGLTLMEILDNLKESVPELKQSIDKIINKLGYEY